MFSRTITISTPQLAEVAPHARIVFAGADAGEQAQLLPQMDVDRAKAGADGRGDRGLEGAAACGGRWPARYRAAACRVLAITSTPASCTSQLIFHAGGIDAHAGRFGQFRSGAVAGDQGYVVSH